MDSMISLRTISEERPRTPPPSRLRRLIFRPDIFVCHGFDEKSDNNNDTYSKK